MTDTPAPTLEERLHALEVLTGPPVVIGPGETLVIRTATMTAAQMHDYQQALDISHENGVLPFRAVVVYGEELAVARPAPELRTIDLREQLSLPEQPAP